MIRRHPSPGCATASAGTIPAYRLKLHYLASFCATFTPFYATTRNRATFKFGLVKPFVSIGSTVTSVTLTFPHARERKKSSVFRPFSIRHFFLFSIYICVNFCVTMLPIPETPITAVDLAVTLPMLPNVTACYLNRTEARNRHPLGFG